MKMNDIIQIVIYAVSMAVALIAGWQTVRAKINETNLKKVGGKVDIIPLIYEAILTVEKLKNGCPAGEDKFIHGQKKKKAAIELIVGECAKRNILFDYNFVVSKIEEVFFVIRGFESQLKADIKHKQD